MLLSALETLIGQILSGFRPQAARILRSVDTLDRPDAIEAIKKPLWELVVAARSEAASAGARFAVEQARDAGYRIDPPPQPGYAPQAVQTVLRENFLGPDPYERVVERLETHIRDASRDSIVTVAHEATENGDTDPGVDHTDLGWARVLRGDTNCAFCVMLASRGPVYESAEAAGRVSARTKWLDATGWINSYHDNCDCAVVLVPKNKSWQGWDQVRAARKIYKRAAERVEDKYGDIANGKHYSENSMIREIDRMLREHAESGDPVEIPAIAA